MRQDSETRAVCIHTALAAGQVTQREYAEMIGTFRCDELIELSRCLTEDFYADLRAMLTDVELARVMRS